MTIGVKMAVDYVQPFRDAVKVIPIDDLDVWADKNRRLPDGKNAEPGQWRTSRVPYTRAIMKSLSKSSPCKKVVIMGGAQVAKTAVLENFVGQAVDQDPCPILCAGPKIDFMSKWSKDRLQPMFDESPCFKNKIKEAKKRDGGNNILLKYFPSGSINMIGYNSAGSMRGVSIKKFTADEIDAASLDIQGEGDFLEILDKRLSTFRNSKTLLVSTPTFKDLSRIEYEFLNSSQEFFYIPCPFCDHYQIIRWHNMILDKDNPENTYLQCESEKCKGKITEGYKDVFLANGKWVSHNLKVTKIRGFHLSSLYSPLGWRSWADITDEWYRAQGRPTKLKVFFNTVLGETYEDAAESVEFLGARREVYNAEIPKKAMVVTCAVDLQDNRLEALTVAWGLGGESWAIELAVFQGSPIEDLVWDQLDLHLQKTYKHESGVDLRIVSTCIDTGGSKGFSARTLKFCKGKLGRRIFAIKGGSTYGAPAVSRPRKSSLSGVSHFILGTDTIKRTVFYNFRISEPGPGYCHFNETFDDEFFKQLTAEKVVVKEIKGRYVRLYEKAPGRRNEGIDLYVYNHAALELMRPNWYKIAKSFVVEDPTEEELAENSTEDQDDNDENNSENGEKERKTDPEKPAPFKPIAKKKDFYKQKRIYRRGNYVTRK